MSSGHGRESRLVAATDFSEEIAVFEHAMNDPVIRQIFLDSVCWFFLVSGIVGSDRFRNKFAERGLSARAEPADAVARKLEASDARLGPMIKAMNLTLV